MAYLDATEAKTDEEREAKLKDHAAQIRTHLGQLSKKAYWEQFTPAPEFVVLFLPGEDFFSAALRHDPSLIEAGVSEKVILATPTTLIALLKAVSYGWRQEKLTENAQHISELGKELYKRLSDLTGHWAGVGDQLKKAVDTYNKAVGSFETRVLVTARKFKELGVEGNEERLEDLTPVEVSPREMRGEALSLEGGDKPRRV
jgi:DNA recombination protein RmuC